MWNMGGKVAIVTGAANGIGRAIAGMFAAEGAAVVVVDVEKEAAEQTAEWIAERCGRAKVALCDVGDSQAVSGMVDSALNEFGRIDVLVANAAVQITKSVTETDEEEWDRIQRINLKGVFLCSKYVVRAMERQRSGSIIITSSGHAFATYPKCSAYAASKGGELAFMRGLALDCAPHGIRVNCVIPGATDTRLVRGYVEASADPEQTLRQLLDSIPMGRLAAPEDIARAVLFLASDHASYITGTSLVVDGGLLAQA